MSVSSCFLDLFPIEPCCFLKKRCCCFQRFGRKQEASTPPGTQGSFVSYLGNRAVSCFLAGNGWFPAFVSWRSRGRSGDCRLFPSVSCVVSSQKRLSVSCFLRKRWKQRGQETKKQKGSKPPGTRGYMFASRKQGTVLFPPQETKLLLALFSDLFPARGPRRPSAEVSLCSFT